MDRRVSIDAHSIAAVPCPPIEWNQLVRNEGYRMVNGHGRANGAHIIEILTDFPDNVVAAAARGIVTKQDYQDTLIPRVELTLKRYPKIRCYYDLGAQFSKMEPGAMGGISKSESSISRDGSVWRSSRMSSGSGKRSMSSAS
jgi:hypothetical protein